MTATKRIDHAAYAKDCRRRSEAELLFIIADCRATLAAWHDCPNAGYYMDEIHYATAELERRRRGGRRAKGQPGPTMAALVAAAVPKGDAAELARLTPDELADELQYAADYQF